MATTQLPEPQRPPNDVRRGRRLLEVVERDGGVWLLVLVCTLTSLLALVMRAWVG